MVQVLQRSPKKPSGWEMFFENLGQGAGDLGKGLGLHPFNQEKKAKEEEKREKRRSAVSEYLGVDLPEGLGDDDLNQIVKYGFQKELAGLKQSGISPEKEKQRRDVIEKHFGSEAAEIYDAAPEGGKTAIVQNLLENAQRGQQLKDILPNQRDHENIIKTKDFDKGLTPKERVVRQDQRYNKNLPIYQESQAKMQALEHEQDSLNVLEELSPKISGWERVNINPQTGSLIIPSAASPEAQLFLKTVNDFTVNAKDSFGARVSNFELDRFMQRLPTLANSEQGRAMILRQMKIINEMNLLRNQTLQNVFEEYGGIRNIDYDEAERVAEKTIKPQMQQLKKEMITLDRSLDAMHNEKLQKNKKKVPTDSVAVQRSDGTTGYIPKNKLKKFLSVPGNKAL